MRIPIRKTHAVIDLDAVEHNIHTLWNRAGREKGYLVLLKADAYGHGSVAVGKLAEEMGVFAGGVAALEEVEYLRRRGLSLPLVLLEDLFFDEIAPALERDVRLSVSSLVYAREIQRVAEEYRRVVPVHINIDTGMGRLGIRAVKALECIKEIAALPNLKIEGLFTHFPASDEKEKDFCFKQMELFKDLVKKLKING